MEKFGNLSKMRVEQAKPIHYQLPLGEFLIPLNPYIGKKLTLEFTGRIHCVACGRSIKKSYQQGYCFPCTQKLAQCDLCILKPELCHYHKGTCREPKWGESHCMIPHVVYLSNTSDLKIGITRESQIPTRWIDQGAVAAIKLLRVHTRRISGLFEHALKEQMSDKTNWRNMLKNVYPELNLQQAKADLLAGNPDLIEALRQEFSTEAVEISDDNNVYEFEYPVLEYPQKVKSLSFDKTQTVEGQLMGIKGQYLIFSEGVINIRKFSGYEVKLRK